MAHSATLQAVLLLALAASAAAWTCTASRMVLHYVAPRESTDAMAKCLTGMRVDMAANCGITLTSLNAAGNLVDGIWAGDDSKVHDRWMECPKGSGPTILPVNTGTKVDAVKNAFIKAIRGYVYGFTTDLQYKKDIVVNDVDWFPGKVIVRRTGAPNLVYAIVEDTTVDADLNSDNGQSLTPVTSCTQLFASDPDYNADHLCIPNPQAADPCPDNSVGIMVKPNLNQWSEQLTQFKICALCIAGTAGNGFGCTSCKAGQYSTIGGACNPCPPGTYSNAGSSNCIPCPAGTYNDEFEAKTCKQCPEDSYSWIPGAEFCLRCIQGIPEICGGGSCPSGDPSPGEKMSSPGTHILSVDRMATCGLDATAEEYEVKAWTKCASWKSGSSPRMQLALRVLGDCSIQISPITDPTCADPTEPEGGERLPYGSIQMTAYYKNPDEIRTLMAPGQKKSLMLAIDQGTSGVVLKYFGATTDPEEGEDTTFIKDPPGSATVKMCTVNAQVTGGQVVNLPGGGPDTDCPPGSYYHGEEYCPVCPVGYRCPGGPAGANTIIPCQPNFFNSILGLAGACTACPSGGAWTSYEGAASCTVEKLDIECKLANTGGTGMEFDKAAQACMPCAPGTARDDNANICVDCPAGYYSGEGAAECEPCPEGQYNPSPGLPDQSDITGMKCIACAEGSMPLKSGSAAVDAPVERGATFCDACPAGTWKPVDPVDGPATPCELCQPFTYRAGDATPENNKCRPVPAGYMLADSTHTTLALCPRGTVSFWYEDEFGTTVRAPGKAPEDELRCIACADVDEEVGNTITGDLKFAHTYSPRRGMTKCIPCPAGTVPLSDGDGVDKITMACKACDHGEYRDAYTISASCLDCGKGMEVGSSSKMDCVMCRPGYFMTEDRAKRKSPEANSCEPCQQNYYRPTYGATSCLPCPRGTMTQDEGNVECTECPVGYYNNNVGDVCKPAPAGTFINSTGAFVTTPCPQGTWNDEEASDNCNPCAPGKYSNTFGAKECKTCPAGTYSGGQATSCIDCNPGFSSPAGASACSPCKPGTYAPNNKTPQCLQCPKGFQCPTNAMRKEGPCPRGTFSNREGLRLCIPCPINTFSNGGGSATSTAPQAVMACTKCPVGTNTRGLTGQSKCQAIRPQVRRMKS